MIKMPGRRRGVNERVVHVRSDGTELKVFVTANFSPESGRVAEVFSANTMSGSDIEAMMTDACILMSLCLQAGVSLAEIVEKLGDRRRHHEDQPGPPTSVIGSIARAAKAIDDEVLGGAI